MKKSDILRLKNAPVFLSSSTVVGKKEFEGPLGRLFDLHGDDDKFGKDTWEQSESEMQRMALELAIHKAKIKKEDVGAVFAGDLINQCTGSAYGLIDFNIPYFGLYGACSTAAEGLILASLVLNSGVYDRVAVTTSSHNCSAERQFRFPIEYGSQRTPTSQWTVTGAASFILGFDAGNAYITEVLPGRSVDKGISDANNMGAAMAPVNVKGGLLFFLKKFQIGSHSAFYAVLTILLLASIYSNAVSKASLNLKSMVTLPPS